MSERWVVVENYPDYEISDAGRVRRLTSVTCTHAGRILKSPLRVGYPSVDLCCGGFRRTQLVHRLVAAAFIGPSQGREVNHINCNKTDCRALNLEYVTRSENQLHAYRNGLQIADGEHNGFAKLTWDKVARIRALANEPNRPSMAEIGRAFGVSGGNIKHILHGETWKNQTLTEAFAPCELCKETPGWVATVDLTQTARVTRCACWLRWSEQRQIAATA